MSIYLHLRTIEGEADEIKKIFQVFFVIFIIAQLVSCSTPQALPNATAISLKQSLTFDEFTKFQNLFSEGKQSTATRELFEKLKKINSAGALFKSYTVIALDNGEMLLVNLTPNEEQAVQSITVIPQEYKVLFTE